jgi:glycosyltransferase involved in cell wall biosynthesis
VVVHNALQAKAAEHAGVAANKIRVIPHWVADEELVAPVRGDHVLFVGRLVREKGVDVLIRAAAMTGTSVRVVGEGAMRREWESLIDGTGADVTMLGWRSHDEVLSELRAARALVVPSIWPEVWGLVITEAFAAGVPVIASEVGGITDLLAGGRGYLIQANDPDSLASALRQIADNPEEANARARDARDYAREHLSYGRWRQEYGEVYEALSDA